jgi:hypothetical protein
MAHLTEGWIDVGGIIAEKARLMMAALGGY